MGTNRKRLLNDFTALEAFLTGVSGVHSYDFVPSTFSLCTQDIEERAPTSIHDGLRQMMVFYHIGDLKVFNDNVAIPICIGFSCLEMVITPLAIDLEMGLGDVTGRFSLAMTSLLAAAQHTLFASEGLLRCPVKPGVLYCVPPRISQEVLEPDINTDIAMLTSTRCVLTLRFILANDKGIPVTISTQNKMNRLRRSF
ncbi:MAG: hypothetical protein AUG51_20825 [Acidobacteria bacterium 13_1_20CM_3_53_8]|nr:MAG: hypothetical protein AUG51_20825 [Acidobacteria bacterium 13_1_20CM_3_53_8]